jgi:hypothetical protein
VQEQAVSARTHTHENTERLVGPGLPSGRPGLQEEGITSTADPCQYGNARRREVIPQGRHDSESCAVTEKSAMQKDSHNMMTWTATLGDLTFRQPGLVVPKAAAKPASRILNLRQVMGKVLASNWEKCWQPSSMDPRRLSTISTASALRLQYTADGMCPSIPRSHLDSWELKTQKPARCHTPYQRVLCSKISSMPVHANQQAGSFMPAWAGQLSDSGTATGPEEVRNSYPTYTSCNSSEAINTLHEYHGIS